MAGGNLIKQFVRAGLVARVTDGLTRVLAERLAQGPIALIAASILPLTACIWGILFHCYA